MASAARDKSESWWKRRTKLERNTILFLVVAILIIIGLVIGIVLESRKLRNNRPAELGRKSICWTSACVQASSDILKSMDSSVDPCDDFYQFACGKFLKEAVIPSDDTEVATFSVIEETIETNTKLLLEEPPEKGEPKPFVLLKNMYKACMNDVARDNEDLKPIQDFLKELGGWPILERKNWTEIGWVECMERFRKNRLGTNSFLTFVIDTDAKNSSKTVLTVSEAYVSYEEHMKKGFNDTVVKAYEGYLVNLAAYFGADRKFAEYEVRNLLDFEIKLAQLSMSPEQRRNLTALYNPTKIAQLQKMFPSIDWLKIINISKGLPNRTLATDDTVIVESAAYISKFEKLLKRTSNRTLINFAMFDVLNSLMFWLPKELQNRKHDLSTSIVGSYDMPAQWKQCKTFAASRLGIAMSAMYVRKYFTKEAKGNVIKMVENIRKEFLKNLEEIEWMDEGTKEKARDKVKAMTVHIGYADELLDDKILEDYYSELDVDLTQGTMKVYLNISEFRRNKTRMELWKPINKTDWTTRISPRTVNAGYDFNENSIQFPAGILQKAFFNNDRPNYMNYGGIGFVIGHEITHGFDDQGRKFDKFGNLKNWWPENIDEAFAAKAQCIIDQYGNYTIPELGINVNGIVTQGENIADNGGIKLAYLAYKKWVEHNEEELRLPGLNYGPGQMFWISMANSWCEKEQLKSIQEYDENEDHPKWQHRIQGMVSNSKHFAKDFRCPEGSKMNPKHKCRVW